MNLCSWQTFWVIRQNLLTLNCNKRNLLMLSWFVIIENNLKIIKLDGRELLGAGTYNNQNFYNYESGVE